MVPVQALSGDFLNTAPPQPSLLQEAAFLRGMCLFFITFLLSKQRETSGLDSNLVEKKTVSADFETFIQDGAKENIHFLQ